MKINKEYLNQEIGTSSMLLESGAFVCRILKAIHLTANSTLSEAVVLEVETDTKRNAKLNLFYQDANGEEIKWNVKHLTDLIYLTGIRDYDKKETFKNEKGRNETRYINLEDINIGIFINYIDSEEKLTTDGRIITQHNYRVDGFFDTKTKQTANEKHNNKEAEIIFKKVEQYKENNKEEKQVKKLVAKNNKLNNKEEEEDGFPF